MDEVTKNKHLKVLIWIAYIVIGWYIVMYWLPLIIVWLLPFILAYFVASITQPLKNFCEKRIHMPKKIAARVAWAFALIVFSAVVGFIVTKMVIEMINFATNSPAYIESATITINNISERFVSWQAALPDSYNALIEMAVTSLTTQTMAILGSFSQTAMTWIKDIATALPGFLLFWLIFIVASYFMCKDFALIKRWLMLQIPLRRRGQVTQIKGFATTAITKYFRGMGIMLGIVFCVLLTGLLVLGVNYAFWIAFFLAILEILPLIGTGIVLVPWGLYTIFIAHSLPVGIGLLVLYLVNIVIRQLAEPKIISKSLGLHPMITLIAIYVGLKTFGFTGVIVFPIIALVLVSLQRAGVLKFWQSD
ncbi:MAG: sporulation integral membrane protein YtvI [Clostridiales bacterium]|jgi:sporulation integral membrane protein YtvI|nr:sporulation integral membrane protein YtvI [Clostridiales bacterium]